MTLHQEIVNSMSTPSSPSVAEAGSQGASSPPTPPPARLGSRKFVSLMGDKHAASWPSLGGNPPLPIPGRKGCDVVNNLDDNPQNITCLYSSK